MGTDEKNQDAPAASDNSGITAPVKPGVISGLRRRFDLTIQGLMRRMGRLWGRKDSKTASAAQSTSATEVTNSPSAESTSATEVTSPLSAESTSATEVANEAVSASTTEMANSLGAESSPTPIAEFTSATEVVNISAAKSVSIPESALTLDRPSTSEKTSKPESFAPAAQVSRTGPCQAIELAGALSDFAARRNRRGVESRFLNLLEESFEKHRLSAPANAVVDQIANVWEKMTAQDQDPSWTSLSISFYRGMLHIDLATDGRGFESEKILRSEFESDPAWRALADFVQEHQGEATLRSRRNVRTVVNLQLPLKDSAA